jgi:8-oxo-dGTP pyrophosphatase MutT (NUDIX family)
MPIQNPRELDPRFVTLRSGLLPATEEIDTHAEMGADRIHAAVSVVLREGAELELLLIRRAESEGDPWSGQMALPGGRWDSTDASLLHTAIRETQEETAVDLQNGGIPLGRLEGMVPASQRLPAITIFPFVFGVPADTQAEVFSYEIQEVLWVPLATLLDPETAGSVEIARGEGQTRDFPCWRVGERVIWGLTYRILTRFFQELRLAGV